MKILEDGRTGLGWREAKGKKAVNLGECQEAYRKWWREWVEQEGLMPVLLSASGLQDTFGSAPPSICQATVLWEIRNDSKGA